MRQSFICCVVAAALLLPTAALHGQVLRFERLTQDDGLTQNYVTAIAQDSFGFLWIGTQDGLNRYDGYDVRRFRADGSSTSLQGAYVRDLATTSDGTVWVAMREGGLSRWDPKSETFRTWKKVPGHPWLESLDAILVNHDGTLWIGAMEGLARFDPRSESFELLDPKFEAAFLHRDSAGTVWAGNRDGSVSWIGDDHRLHAVRSEHGPITTMTAARDGRTLVGTASGAVLTLDPRTRSFSRVEGIAAPEAVGALMLDRRGALWVGTRGGGILRLDQGSTIPRVIANDTTDLHSIPDDTVAELFEDRSGVVWAGTPLGAARHDPASAAFRVYRAAPDGPADRYVWAAQSDRDGNVWIGTNGGLSRFEKATKSWRSWAADPEGTKGPISTTVSAILVDRSGAVWAGGNRGLSRYDPQSDSFESWKRDRENAPIRARVFSLLETRDGRIFVGTGRGLMRWRPETRTFTHAGPEGLWPAVFSIAEDADGSIWLGTFHNGLYRLDRETTTVDRGGLDLDLQQISATYADSRGRLWIGTSHGIFRRDAGSTALTRYRIANGLLNEMIMGFVEARDGSIWVSTNQGIARLDPSNGAIRSWTSDDGLPSNEFNQMAAGRSPSGDVLFGTPAGVVMFDPATLQVDRTPPQIAITGLEVLNAPVPIGKRDGSFSLAQSIVTTRSLELSHREKVVTFTFAGLHYAAPGETRYAYRLVGWDDAWRDAPARRRHATYTNLPPGRYVFRVRAANKGGVWNESGAAISVRVLPPPWRTWWAYTLYVVAAVALLALFVGTRLRSLRKRQRELEHLVQVRTEQLARANEAKSVFLANMSHELRTPLNAVLGFAQLLDRSRAIQGEDRKSVEIIRRAGEHLLGLINDVLSLSKIEAGRLTMDIRPFSLRNVLKGVEAMMRSRADKAGLRLVIEADERIPEAVLGDEGKLRQVLVNLMGNAVKFTERGTITLRASWSEGRAHFEVEDTGKGIAAEEQSKLFQPFVQTESGRSSKEGTGLGLAITREIVRLMDGDIAVRSTPGEGTRFSFDAAMPQTSSDEEQTAIGGRVIAVAPGERPRRIVVADDHPDNRLLIVRLLGALGFRVVEATNGEEAVAAWERERPDLVLMDMRMPVLDGRDATRLIRERERQQALERTPIVALTASAFEHERDEILACGADDFLTKPFAEERLFRLIQQQTGITFITEAEAERPAATGVTREHIVRLSAEESQRLRDVLDSGDVEKAAEVAMKIRLRDDGLGRDLLSDIRAYRIDHLLDLLESR